jgi:short subunit dehydrogenase-like uncharacterized protein
MTFYQGDPGYKCTALMAMESALVLALNRDLCDKDGGVLTPAAGMAEPLTTRLRGAGMVLRVDD